MEATSLTAHWYQHLGIRRLIDDIASNHLLRRQNTKAINTNGCQRELPTCTTDVAKNYPASRALFALGPHHLFRKAQQHFKQSLKLSCVTENPFFHPQKIAVRTVIQLPHWAGLLGAAALSGLSSMVSDSHKPKIQEATSLPPASLLLSSLPLLSSCPGNNPNQHKVKTAGFGAHCCPHRHCSSLLGEPSARHIPKSRLLFEVCGSRLD